MAGQIDLGRLKGASLSTCSQRVLVVVYELGGELPLDEVNYQENEHKKLPYLNLQPFGQVPALLEADGWSVFESRAIARYIDLQYGGKLLHIHDKRKYAKVENWISVETFQFDPHVAGIARELFFNKIVYNKEPDLVKVEEYKQKLHATLVIYDKHLSTNQYLAGDELSLADLVHLPYAARAFNVLPDLLEPHQHVKRWWDTISNLPSWKRVVGK